MQLWEKHLSHEKAIRDGYVACGNTPPAEPDPPGGLIKVKVRKFNSEVFWPFIGKLGHTSAEFAICDCAKK